MNLPNEPGSDGCGGCSLLVGLFLLYLFVVSTNGYGLLIISGMLGVWVLTSITPPLIEYFTESVLPALGRLAQAISESVIYLAQLTKAAFVS